MHENRKKNTGQVIEFRFQFIMIYYKSNYGIISLK